MIGKLANDFGDIVREKYAHHICLKMIKYCPSHELRRKIIHNIIDKLDLLIMNVVSSEVIEQLYLSCQASDKRELVIGFYGKFFILLKENANLNLKEVF